MTNLQTSNRPLGIKKTLQSNETHAMTLKEDMIMTKKS